MLCRSLHQKLPSGNNVACSDLQCPLYCETTALHLIPPIEVHYPEVEMAEENQGKANRGGNHITATNSSIDFFISYNGADKTWAE
jgi:hypothetical protein